MNSWRRRNCRSPRCSRPSRCSNERGSSRALTAGTDRRARCSAPSHRSGQGPVRVGDGWLPELDSLCYPDGRIRPSVMRAKRGAPIPSAPSDAARSCIAEAPHRDPGTACAARRVRVDGPWQIQVHPRRGRDRPRWDRGARCHRVRSSGCHERVADERHRPIDAGRVQDGRGERTSTFARPPASCSAPRCSAIRSVERLDPAGGPVPARVERGRYARLDRPDGRLAAIDLLHGHGRRRRACREWTADDQARSRRLPHP
jgi:hypothetical protein